MTKWKPFVKQLYVAFIWNTRSLPHSLLICISLLACLLARTDTIYNTYTMILAKRSRVYTVLLKQTNIWLCTIKNKQLIALLSVLFRFLHYFVIRCFDVRIKWTLCDRWSALSRRPSYVSPCMRCCFSFCLCEAFGRYKCARTHTSSTNRSVCVFILKSAHTNTFTYCHNGSRRQTPEETLLHVFHSRWASHPFFGAVV